MVTILSSYAQEESYSASENRKWRARKDFEKGIIGSATMFGYRRNADGVLEIEPSEAEIVHMIFNDYLSGMGQTAIAKKLNEMGIHTRQGNSWTNLRIKELLYNEKYIGNLLLKKFYLNNHIENIKTKNNGELPRYLVENAHEAIIDKETFYKVQELLSERKQQYSHEGSTKRYTLSGMLQCKACGKNYQRKVYPQGAAWLCATYARKGKKYCPTAKQIPENILISVICDILNIDAFDETVVKSKIKQIIVPEPNELLFIFHDCQQVQKHWENVSRSESWTDEMKQQARERSLKWNVK